MIVDRDDFNEIDADSNRRQGNPSRQLLDMLRCQFDFVQVRANLLPKRHFTRHLILDRRTYSGGTPRASSQSAHRVTNYDHQERLPTIGREEVCYLGAMHE